MADELPALGELERDVMQLVWKSTGITADNVREQLGRPLKESTIRTVLTRLEDKGYVRHTLDGRTYVYHAAKARRAVAARAVKGVVDWICNGSMEDVLVGLVDAKMLDAKELKALSEKITKAQRGKK